jgi:hypothetical protein
MVRTIVAPTTVASVISTGYDKWWLPCGCNPIDCLSAYAAQGAASYAASKINLANPGVNNLIDAALFPTWNNVDGWIYDGTIGHGLSTQAMNIHQDISIIIKYSGWVNAAFNYMVVHEEGVKTHGIKIISGDGLTGIVDNVNTHTHTSPASAVVALTRLGVYVNGTLVSSLPAPSVFSTVGSYGIGNDDNFYYMFRGNMQAVAFYNKLLLPKWIIDITNSLNSL